MSTFDTLIKQLQIHQKLCVAFSGGVDSAFLLKAARDALGDGVYAVIADGVMAPRRAVREAVALAEQLGVAYDIVTVDALAVPAFAQNDRTRCYYCKKHIFTAIKAKAADRGFTTVADGTNADDANAFRPGRQAAAELGVVSPLLEAGLTKADIRRMSRDAGLSTWDKPPDACLATRLPYGTPVTADLLTRIERAEERLEAVGVVGGRARVHGGVLRIEAPRDSFGRLIGDDTLTADLKALGFTYITLDLEGVRSGSMD